MELRYIESLYMGQITNTSATSVDMCEYITSHELCIRFARFLSWLRWLSFAWVGLNQIIPSSLHQTIYYINSQNWRPLIESLKVILVNASTFGLTVIGSSSRAGEKNFLGKITNVLIWCNQRLSRIGWHVSPLCCVIVQDARVAWVFLCRPFT